MFPSVCPMKGLQNFKSVDQQLTPPMFSFTNLLLDSILYFYTCTLTAQVKNSYIYDHIHYC